MVFDAQLPAIVAEHFSPISGYLNTAAVGLPTRSGIEAARQRLDDWENGICDPVSFDSEVERSRAAFATISGTDISRVGVASQVSVISGMVATSLHEGAVVLLAEEDFTSVLFPFLADSRLTVHTVPVDSLIDSIDGDIDCVAVSAVQSSDGTVLDLDALANAADNAGVRTFVDTTQAAGWLPMNSTRFDVTACHAYKWLCSPRGTAFLTVEPEAHDWLKPINAGWYAGADPWQSIYGPPLRLAPDAKRFNLSPDWFSFAAAAPTLELLAELGPDEIGARSTTLANEFRRLVGLGPSNSAIVSIDSDAGPALASAGLSASQRAGRVRLSFYLYNTLEDVHRAVEVVGPINRQ